MKKILLTGGSGRLGTEIQNLLPDVFAPKSKELDVSNYEQARLIIENHKPKIIIHAAAYTNVLLAEKEKDVCWKINVLGTRNIAHAANSVGAKLIHISTDYVFDGVSGNYTEEDVPGPVVNYYSLTKLIAEESARIARDHLIIRTSFRPREFAYPMAFDDIFTSQDYVDIIAPEIVRAVNLSHKIEKEIIHIATERKSVYELAVRRRPDVMRGKKDEAGVKLPNDVSLNTDYWQSLKNIK